MTINFDILHDDVMDFRAEDFTSFEGWVTEALVEADRLLEEADYYLHLAWDYADCGYTPEEEYGSLGTRLRNEAKCLVEAIWPLIIPHGRKAVDAVEEDFSFGSLAHNRAVRRG